MFMNIIVIIFVLAIAYTWMSRGAFNAMIQALCVFFAGAIAFSVWEPLAHILLGVSDNAIVEGSAWGVSLILPFAIMMLVFRIAADKVLKANLKNTTAVDYGLGAVFGLITSVLTAGVLVIGIGYMRLPSAFLGYQPVWYSEDRAGAGSLVENQKLWIPVDTLTATVYKNLSGGAMSSGEPLKKWYPDLTLTGFAARINQGDGSARNAITEEGFKVTSSYIIGDPSGNNENSKKSVVVGDLPFVDIDGKKIEGEIAGHVAGYVVEFGPKAKEKGSKGGQVVVSNGQIRLLTERADGSTHTIFPIATISESSQQGQYGRWVFDSPDLFITSVGGKSRVPMGFEFFVPADEIPLALYVKGIRVPVSDIQEPREFDSASARQKLIQTGSLLTGNRVKRKFDLSEAVVVDESQTGAQFGHSLGTVISSQLIKQRGITIDEDNLVTGGSSKFDTKEETGRKNASQEKRLRVDKLFVGNGQLMVQVKVGSGEAGGFLSEAGKTLAKGDEPFMLIDTNDNEYEAVGYIYEDSTINLFELRYTPGDTLSGLDESGLPRISRSKDGQDLTLLFLVSNNVKIKYFTIGDVVLVHYDPELSGN